MSSMVLVTRVQSSAFHLLASQRSQDAMSYPFCEALSRRMRGSIMRSNNNGDRGVALQGAALDPDWERVAVGSDKLWCGPVV
jgi:hypothetical protein